MKKVKAIRVGDPLDPDIHMGAVISEDHLKKVLGFVDIAKQEVSSNFSLDQPGNKKAHGVQKDTGPGISK